MRPRRIAFILLVAILSVGYIAAPAYTVPTVSTNKSEYQQGELATISGSGAVADQLVSIEVKDAKGALAFSTIVSATSTGTFSAQFRLREDAPQGTWSVTATDSTGTSEVATFTVAAPTKLDRATLEQSAKAVDPATGVAKTEFKRGESVKFEWILKTTEGSGDVVWRITLQQPDLTVFTIVDTSASVSTSPKTFSFTQLLLSSVETGAWKAIIQIFETDGRTPLGVATVTFTVST